MLNALLPLFRSRIVKRSFSEVQKAQVAVPNPSGDTIFSRIINGSIPASFLHKVVMRKREYLPSLILSQDDLCVAIEDVSPQAPFHFLVIPRKPITGIGGASAEDVKILGHLLLTAKELAKEHGFAESGYR